MHKHYFPRCPVDGPIEPTVPYGHLVSRGAVPAKCAACANLFEGGCTRAIMLVGGYLHLDHGPCGINGPTDPVIYEDEFITAKVEVPRKCRRCRFLGVEAILGFVCRKDADVWGDLRRGLDWGHWEPDVVYLQLPLPKLTTRLLSEAVYADDLLGFVREHRRVNPGLSLREAREDFESLRVRAGLAQKR